MHLSIQKEDFLSQLNLCFVLVRFQCCPFFDCRIHCLDQADCFTAKSLDYYVQKVNCTKFIASFECVCFIVIVKPIRQQESLIFHQFYLFCCLYTLSYFSYVLCGAEHSWPSWYSFEFHFHLFSVCFHFCHSIWQVAFYFVFTSFVYE